MDTPTLSHKSILRSLGVIEAPLRKHAFRSQGCVDVLIEPSPKKAPMMAEHGETCSGEEATFCMNGGTCYKLPSMNSLSCICQRLYTGSRCETLSLFTSAQSGHNHGLIAAVLIVAILIALAVAVFIYYIIKRHHVQRKEEQDGDQQGHYWKVKSRA